MQAEIALHTERWLPEAPPKAVTMIAHGYGEHIGRYAHVISALTGRGYAVYGLDHRGHGRSPGPRARITRFDEYVDDLHLLGRRVAGEWPDLPCFLIGHSMGGLIAVRYALRYQSELSGLVVSDPALRITDDIPQFVQKIGQAIAVVAPGLPLVPPKINNILSTDPAVEAAFKADPLCYHGWTTAGMARQLLLAGEDARRRLDQLTLPLLIMHGGDDHLTSPAGSRQLYEQAQNADKTFKIWPGLRHEIFNEPIRDEVITFMLDWLDAHTTPHS